MSIQDIITGCQKGEANCQRELVNRYSAVLYTVCLRYLKAPMIAQDNLQDSFIKIFKAIKNFDPAKGSLEGWMRKITINTALKKIDRNKLKTSSLTYETAETSYGDPTVIDKLEAEDLIEIIQTLPDGYRQVFNLSVIEGYSHKEIGSLLGIAEVTSRSNLSRAKNILRKKLSTLENISPWVKIS